MANVRSKEQNFTVEYIRLYRELPELWNVKSKEYHDRYKKKTAYEILLRKYREFYIEATMEDLKKKLNALRTNYRKELRKYFRNKEHKPSLWYFGEMCFINNIDFSQDFDDCNENTQFTIEYVEEDDDTLFDTESPSTLDHLENSQCYKDLPTPPKKLASHKVSNSEENYQSEGASYQKNRHYYHENDQYIKDFSTPLKKLKTPKSNSEEPHQSLKRDEYFHWAMACAADLRKMERTQQVYAKKAVAEILMEGQLGTLNRDSVKVNQHLNNSVLVKIGSPPSPIYENNPLLLQNEQE